MTLSPKFTIRRLKLVNYKILIKFHLPFATFRFSFLIERHWCRSVIVECAGMHNKMFNSIQITPCNYLKLIFWLIITKSNGNGNHLQFASCNCVDEWKRRNINFKIRFDEKYSRIFVCFREINKNGEAQSLRNNYSIISFWAKRQECFVFQKFNSIM